MNSSTAWIVVLLVITVALLSPLFILFAVNTLFGTSLAYSFANWFSVLILKGTVVGIARQFGKG
jgi:hypothetical protein